MTSMSAERRHLPSTTQPTGGQPTLGQPTTGRRLTAHAPALMTALVLTLALAPALAAPKHPTLVKPVQPSSTGAAKTARQALLKERTKSVPRTVPKPGKIVGGTTTPPPKTIVTKRFLPK
jgi:hypothetical protein